MIWSVPLARQRAPNGARAAHRLRDKSRPLTRVARYRRAQRVPAVCADRRSIVLLVDDALGATVRGVVVVLDLDLGVARGGSPCRAHPVLTRRRIHAETQAKLGRVDVSKTALFNEAFSLSEPKEGAARVRLAENDGSRTYENLHRDARAFADGLYTAIRNPGMHTPPPSDGGEEQIALEQRAAFSLLARWVHQADVGEA
jgi:hypothetical protein